MSKSLNSCFRVRLFQRIEPLHRTVDALACERRLLGIDQHAQVDVRHAAAELQAVFCFECSLECVSFEGCGTSAQSGECVSMALPTLPVFPLRTIPMSFTQPFFTNVTQSLFPFISTFAFHALERI